MSAARRQTSATRRAASSSSAVCARNRLCLAPTPCPNIDADHSDYLALLRKLRQIPGVKKVFVRSGIRYDYMLCDDNDAFFRELVRYHISGQLKVAPEHCIDTVLDYMGKPHIGTYERFMDEYRQLNHKYDKEQYVVPYLMSSHPGSTLSDAVALAEYLNRRGRQPEQVQDFTPPRHDQHVHVPHRHRPAHDAARLTSPKRRMKGHAARAAAVAPAGQAPARHAINILAFAAMGIDKAKAAPVSGASRRARSSPSPRSAGRSAARWACACSTTRRNTRNFCFGFPALLCLQCAAVVYLILIWKQVL